MSETTELMKRPTRSDCIVKRRALEMFMPRVKDYFFDDWSDAEQPHIEEQLMEVLDEFSDGYHMARELERKGWEEDRALVDLMDEGESLLSRAHKEILKQWIKCYGITPEREIGSRVMVNIYDRKNQVGVISKLYLDEALYGVRFPDQAETSCYLVEYEDVKDAPEVVSANAA